MRFAVPASAVTTRAPTRDGVVALTIDDGPDALFVSLLSALHSAAIPATFFCIGKKVAAARARAEQLVAAGHELQNHSYGHAALLALRSVATVTADLRRAQTLLSEIGPAPRYFRAVAGMVSPPIAAAALALDLRMVHWTATARDGGPFRVSPQRALQRLERGLVPGGILVLHDRAEQPAAHVIPLLAARAKEKNLRFVCLSDLLRR